MDLDENWIKIYNKKSTKEKDNNDKKKSENCHFSDTQSKNPFEGMTDISQVEEKKENDEISSFDVFGIVNEGNEKLNEEPTYSSSFNENNISNCEESTKKEAIISTYEIKTDKHFNGKPIDRNDLAKATLIEKFFRDINIDLERPNRMIQLNKIEVLGDGN